MVVIGLIALLMAILLPVLNKTRQTGRRIVCMSNLRQLTLAWLTYAHDNRDQLVESSTNLAAFPASWVDMGPADVALTKGKLYPYLRNKSVYLCPNDTVNYNRTYSISDYMNGVDWGAPHRAKVLTDIVHPGSTYVFIEEYDNRGWNWGSFVVIEYPSTIWVDVPAVWHDGAGMVSFADGRAEVWVWTDPTTSQLQGFHSVNTPGNSDLMQLQTWLGSGPLPPGFSVY
jgi:prepilin-type processing-associated H-X9-DG protein